NSHYVAITLVREPLLLAESDIGHPLLALLDLKEAAGAATDAVQASTKQEWALEARKLELQGKQEQARAIRETQAGPSGLRAVARPAKIHRGPGAPDSVPRRGGGNAATSQAEDEHRL